MELVPNTGSIVSQPDWTLLLSDPLEVASAEKYWADVTAEMRARSTLAPANAHAIQRLVVVYVLHDRCAREVVEAGVVIRPKTARGIARLEPLFTAMGQLSSDALQLETDLGLSPRRRNAAGKVERKPRSQRASDTYLRPVPNHKPGEA